MAAFSPEYTIESKSALMSNMLDLEKCSEDLVYILDLEKME